MASKFGQEVLLYQGAYDVCNKLGKYQSMSGVVTMGHMHGWLAWAGKKPGLWMVCAHLVDNQDDGHV